MFMFDRWEELEKIGDKDTVERCRVLADAMCRKIFDTIGLGTHDDGICLRVSGRGLTYLFPLRGSEVPVSLFDRVRGPRVLTPRQITYRTNKAKRNKALKNKSKKTRKERKR